MGQGGCDIIFNDTEVVTGSLLLYRDVPAMVLGLASNTLNKIPNLLSGHCNLYIYRFM